MKNKKVYSISQFAIRIFGNIVTGDYAHHRDGAGRLQIRNWGDACGMSW